ncbi:MAG: ester cyclase [Dehalococcoidia bacterium]
MDRTIYGQFIEGVRAAIPAIGDTVEDLVVAGDRAVVRWTGGGIHSGAPLMGVPARTVPVIAHEIQVFRFEGDQIADVWNRWDNLNVLQQPGGMPG